MWKKLLEENVRLNQKLVEVMNQKLAQDSAQRNETLVEVMNQKLAEDSARRNQTLVEVMNQKLAEDSARRNQKLVEDSALQKQTLDQMLSLLSSQARQVSALPNNFEVPVKNPDGHADFVRIFPIRKADDLKKIDELEATALQALVI